MKTIYKNELPPGIKSWRHLCIKYSLVGPMFQLDVKVQEENFLRKYFINTDYAKARAWEEYINGNYHLEVCVLKAKENDGCPN